MNKETIDSLLTAYAHVVEMMSHEETYAGWKEEINFLYNTLRKVLLEATCNG